MNQNVGQPYSFSPHAGIIRFVGGPNDGDWGLFNHDQYDAIRLETACYRKIGSFLFGYVPRLHSAEFWRNWIGG